MTEETDNRAEAERQLASRLAEMRTYNDFDGDPDDGPEELGPVYDWGLEWTKAITDHRNETVTYVHVLSTGGPHEEFRVTFAPSGAIEAVMFVSLPWFDRVEIELHGDDLDTATAFYEANYAGLIDVAETL